VRQYPDYVARVVSDEGDIGRSHLGRFMELETTDTRDPHNITNAHYRRRCTHLQERRHSAGTINSMTEFKQIIGRGTRVRDDYGKLFFNILDYTGSATRLFADPDFDGDPVQITEEEMDADGETWVSRRWSRNRNLSNSKNSAGSWPHF
jgi:type I restriction enzyme R subunit